jgi:hypothetical protein
VQLIIGPKIRYERLQNIGKRATQAQFAILEKKNKKTTKKVRLEKEWGGELWRGVKDSAKRSKDQYASSV